jgi:predicted amidohydrolase
MKDFTIALVQHASPLGSTADNLEATIGWIEKAAKRGADLICLPELGITGHGGHVSMIEAAEPVPDGPSCRRISELAAAHNMYVVAGLAEADRTMVYNTMFVIGPEGYLGKQRKVHLSRDEYFYFRHGTDLPVFELPFGKVGIVICYDNLFPEMSRCLVLDGAELILAPHAARTFERWPRDAAKRRRAIREVKEDWRRVHCCRALDNACYVGICNTAGASTRHIKGVDANHAGGCLVVNPDGNVIAESRSRDIRDEMVITKLSARSLHDRRNQECLNLRVRRPEVFGAITRRTA